MKHLHVIGICGVATSAIAIAFHKKGWKVTGSDKGFYPPVSTHLSEAGVGYYAGWHPEKMIDGGLPDLVMIGAGGTSPSNPEIICAKENKIPLYPYPEILQNYFIKKNSIVVVGTWGKTTASALLSFILIRAGLDPSYFTGGLSLSHDTGYMSDSTVDSASEWSVMEGDEYQVSISDRRPKFAFYQPTHLLLTSVSWDHADLYPTEESYFDAFRELIKNIPAHGNIVACRDEKGVRKILGENGKIAKNIITYGKDVGADYFFGSIEHSKKGLAFSIIHKEIKYAVESPMLGRFNAENIAGCFAMAHQIGILPEQIIAAIKEFKGIKRRFEKRLDGNGARGVTVIDYHAPTPEKAAAALESVREIYHKNIIAVYEPNIGGRQRSSIAMYDNAFAHADAVFIPRLTKTKVDHTNTDPGKIPLEGNELAEYISKTHARVRFIEDDAELTAAIVSDAKKDDCIVFLGSHGFRGMIEETIARLTK